VGRVWICSPGLPGTDDPPVSATHLSPHPILSTCLSFEQSELV
jgi:hypothetical protein